MQATKLQTNYLTAPIGMGTGPLFLSWQCTDGMRQTERRMFRMAFLLMARIRVRSAMRASIPLFYEQSAFCSSFSLELYICLLYTSPSPRDRQKSRMPSSA